MRNLIIRSVIATSVVLVSAALMGTAHAQANLTVTLVGHYGGGGVFMLLSGPVTNTCTAGGNFLANRLDIPSTHSRRKDFLDTAKLALVTGRTVNVYTDACITVFGYKIPTISDAIDATGNLQIN
jgi:hypothetical protein